MGKGFHFLEFDVNKRTKSFSFNPHLASPSQVMLAMWIDIFYA